MGGRGAALHTRLVEAHPGDTTYPTHEGALASVVVRRQHLHKPS
jgi:hypothetical protein